MTKDQELKVEVVDDRLVISIGVGLLAFAVQASSDVSGWPEDWYVAEPGKFAAEVARQLAEYARLQRQGYVERDGILHQRL